MGKTRTTKPSRVAKKRMKTKAKSGAKKKRKPRKLKKRTAMMHHKYILRKLRKLGYTVEGRFQQYTASIHVRSLSRSYGYTPGLPDLEIYNSRGCFVKCGIYFNNPPSSKRVIKILETMGYKIIHLSGPSSATLFKQLEDEYLSLPTSTSRTPRLRRTIDQPLSRYTPLGKRDCRVLEKVFHKKVITSIRSRIKSGLFPASLLLDGKVQGNLPRAANCLSTRMGYLNNIADISIKKLSKNKKFKQLDIELKVGLKKPRPDQWAMLLRVEFEFNHCVVYVNTYNGVAHGVKTVMKIINDYLNKDESTLRKYLLPIK